MNFTIFSAAEQTFSNHVVMHLKTFSREIDVTRFVNRYHWSSQKVLGLFLDILYNNPEIFYVAKSASYLETRKSTGELVSAKLNKISYSIGPSEYQGCKVRLDAAVKLAMQSIQGIRAAELKALRLHDFIVRNCEYDLEVAKSKDISPLARSAYSALVRHKAVCEGYSIAYRHLLNMADIPNVVLDSKEMNHSWNYVQINGKWYHVDVTFDDPFYITGFTGNIPLSKLMDMGLTRLREMGVSLSQKVTGTNNISHKHFLMSDQRARETQHHGWDVKGLPEATDTKYDNYNWKTSN